MQNIVGNFQAVLQIILETYGIASNLALKIENICFEYTMLFKPHLFDVT